MTQPPAAATNPQIALDVQIALTRQSTEQTQGQRKTKGPKRPMSMHQLPFTHIGHSADPRHRRGGTSPGQAFSVSPGSSHTGLSSSTAASSIAEHSSDTEHSTHTERWCHNVRSVRRADTHFAIPKASTANRQQLSMASRATDSPVPISYVSLIHGG